MPAIYFKKEGYDPFIDFLKAYSIVCVLLAHAIPNQLFDYIQFMVWGGMQVPMFVLIQTFHACKQGNVSFNLKKLWKRIIIPFFVVQLVVLVVLLLSSSSSSTEIVIRKTITAGGNGPGSYFVWIYIQIALILPILWPLFVKLTGKQLLFFFVVISLFFDCFFSLIHLSQNVYRLLATRYLFLIFLGAKWVTEGVIINKKTITISLASIIAVEFFVYSKIDLEPFFFTTEWKTHRWACYYYVAILMPSALYNVYIRIKGRKRLFSFIAKIGQSSYEIFLVNMAVFTFFPETIASFMEAGVLRSMFLFTSELFTCIFLGVIFKDRIMPIFNRKYK